MSWKKFTCFNSAPTSETYPDLPRNITYLRLFLGLAYGISLAFRENTPTTTLNGSAGLIFGLNVVTFLPIVYMNYYLNVDTDTYKGLNFVGVANGMALMLLVWLIFFTMLHEDEERILNGALIPNNSSSENSSATNEEYLNGAGSDGIGGQGIGDSSNEDYSEF